jgi:hypothetical protein
MHINDMMMNIEELKTRFKEELTGSWHSCQGTSDMLMSEEWVFLPNGTGRIKQRSVMSGEEIQEFLWKRKGPFCIEIAYDGKEDDDGAPWWVATPYSFCMVENDCGTFPVLVQCDRTDGVPDKGLGPMNVPLMFQGNSDDPFCKVHLRGI